LLGSGQRIVAGLYAGLITPKAAWMGVHDGTTGSVATDIRAFEHHDGGGRSPVAIMQ
jgi:hypothetical protein